MTEWWTYRPSDLLMFAPRTYWRLFELHNEALWPAHLLAALFALLIAGSLWWRKPACVRAGLGALALCWALVAWSFLWQRYAQINTAGGMLTLAFTAQAVGLLALSASGGVQVTAHAHRVHAGLVMLFWAVLAHPWLAWISGRPWTQAEGFGLAPDPTAIGTLGILLCMDAPRRPARVLLFVLRGGALAWCAVSAATLWTMGSHQGWVLAAAVATAIAMLARQRT